MSDWRKINSGVTQGSVLGPLLFLIFINEYVKLICKIFAVDTSLFLKVYDTDISAKESNSDLEKISKWAFQWKMHFNPDPNKLANEIIFSRKTKSSSHPTVAFSNNDIKKHPHHKHLGIVLDSKLDFKFHVDQKIKKCNKLISLIRKLSVNVSRKALLIYTNCLLDLILTMVIFYMINQKMKIFKLEKVQYRACLPITGAIQETSRQRLYKKLGLHSLNKRCWHNKLIFFKKNIKWNGILPKYLYSYLTFPSQENYLLRSASTK